MPANLPPQYHKVELEYRSAQTPAERLEKLREMFRLLPKHKGTEKLQAELKQKISRAKEETDSGRAGAKKTGPSFKVPGEGAGQIALLGHPNSGKSAILAAISHAHPEVAPYPFTTRAPQPGMVKWEDVSFLLVDLPPVTRDYLESWMPSIVRSADAAMLALDLSDDDAPEATEAVLERLAQTHTELVGTLPHDVEEEAIIHVKTVLVGTKLDAPGALDRLSLVQEWFGDRFPILGVSVTTKQGLDELVRKAYDLLEVVRIYTKVPGKPVDRSHPFTIPIGSTVADLASEVHRDLGDRIRFARVWGMSVFDGQTVSREHLLHDGDVVELHS